MIDSPCIEGTGYLEKTGYRRVWRSNVQYREHRVAYEEQVGPIPHGLVIDHLCKNRGCVNVAHLEAVTQTENSRRAAWPKTHCPNGHEYTPENTYVWYGRGYPQHSCNECRREHVRTYAQRKKRQ